MNRKSSQHTTSKNSSDEARTITGPAAQLTHGDPGPADSSVDTAATERPQRTLKDVNILEDLNQELFGSRGLAIVDTKASSTERRPENVENRSVWVWIAYKYLPTTLPSIVVVLGKQV